MKKKKKIMELGITTFLKTDKHGDVSPAERIRQAIEEIHLADQVGLDIYAIG